MYRLNYSLEMPARLGKQSSEAFTWPSAPDPPHFLSSNLLRSLWQRALHGPGAGFYTPSSIPMKSDPFWMVMGAPAALSTNMEVYCPACRGTGDGGDAGPSEPDRAERSVTHL